MSQHYPLEFTLEDGVHVLVNKAETNAYHFTLTPAKGASKQFTYVDDGRSKAEVEESLDFDELNALRRFWLETEDVI